MAKPWIQDANLKEGAFTAKAKAAGKGVQEFARAKAGAPGKLGKQARLAMNFKKMGKKRKKKAAKKTSKPGVFAGMLGKAFGGKGVFPG